MLQDAVRNEAYRLAIARVVKPGDVVLDVGAGTGILSIFAAQAGARKVFAVERSNIANVAREQVRRNGLADRIEVIQVSSEDAVLPEKVDVLVSEWMGGLGNDENILAPLTMARDRFLKPGGVVIPARVTAYLAPTFMPDFDESMNHWRSKPHGVDMSLVAAMTTNEIHATQAPLTPADLFADPQMLWSHDALGVTLAEADSPAQAKLTFAANRKGTVLGFAAWFHAEMAGDIVLTNAVGQPDTHWGRVFFPLNHGVEVESGAPITVDLTCYPSAPGTSEFTWNVDIDGRPTERHDTTKRDFSAG